MDLHAWIAIGTLVVAMILFITKLIPLEATALSIPIVLAVTGTVSPTETVLRGFGNNAVIALAAIFVISAGLKDSGVATLMGRVLERFAGKKEWSLILLIMGTTCLLGTFMSNTATVAIFLPAILVLSRRADILPSKLLMPLGYASVLSGTLTLISTTPNLILSSELHRLSDGAQQLGMFEFTLIGIPICITGIIYMTLVGKKLLGYRGAEKSNRTENFRERLLNKYQPTLKVYKLRVPLGSELIGKTIGNIALGQRYQINLVQVGRTKGLLNKFYDVHADLTIKAGDVLYFGGKEQDVNQLTLDLAIATEEANNDEIEQILGRGISAADVTISPYSAFLDKTLIDIHFRKLFGASVLAIFRRGELIEENVEATPLKLGDALLIVGPTRDINNLESSDDLMFLDRQKSEEDVRRAPIAIFLLAVAILPPVLGRLPLAVSTLISAFFMIATGCVTYQAAQKAIDVRILLLIIGTIPLGDALYQTGVAATLAATLFPAGGPLGPLYVFGVLFAVAALLSTTSNNAAAAVILAPVAYAAAASSGVDVSKAFLAVAYGTSCAFVLPFAHQCNLMIMGPGGYKTKDFIKVGLGLSLVMAATAIFLLSL